MILLDLEKTEAFSFLTSFCSVSRQSSSFYYYSERTHLLYKVLPIRVGATFSVFSHFLLALRSRQLDHWQLKASSLVY